MSCAIAHGFPNVCAIAHGKCAIAHRMRDRAFMRDRACIGCRCSFSTSTSLILGKLSDLWRSLNTKHTGASFIVRWVKFVVYFSTNFPCAIAHGSCAIALVAMRDRASGRTSCAIAHGHARSSAIRCAIWNVCTRAHGKEPSASQFCEWM